MAISPSEYQRVGWEVSALAVSQRNVKRACELLKVSHAAYAARDGQPSDRDREDTELMTRCAPTPAPQRSRRVRHGGST